MVALAHRVAVLGVRVPGEARAAVHVAVVLVPPTERHDEQRRARADAAPKPIAAVRRAQLAGMEELLDPVKEDHVLHSIHAAPRITTHLGRFGHRIATRPHRGMSTVGRPVVTVSERQRGPSGPLCVVPRMRRPHRTKHHASYRAAGEDDRVGSCNDERPVAMPPRATQHVDAPRPP